MSGIDIISKQIISSEILTNLYGFYNLHVVVTILACDILETFNNEIKYIWKKKFGITSLLYVIARYVPFLINVAFLILTLKINAGTLNNVTLKTLNLLYCIPWFVVLACIDYLFIIRAVALNGNSQWLYSILIGSFVGEMITALLFYIPSVPLPTKLTNQLIMLSGSGFPVVFPSVPSVIVFGLPELAFQSVLVLVILRTIVHHRKAWTSREQCCLTTIVIRDGLWGYFFNLFGLLVVVIQPTWMMGPAGQPGIQWSYVTFSVTSSRLLLNIRSGAGGPEIPSCIIPSSLSFSSRPETIEEAR